MAITVGVVIVKQLQAVEMTGDAYISSNAGIPVLSGDDVICSRFWTAAVAQVVTVVVSVVVEVDVGAVTVGAVTAGAVTTGAVDVSPVTVLVPVVVLSMTVVEYESVEVVVRVEVFTSRNDEQKSFAEGYS